MLARKIFIVASIVGLTACSGQSGFSLGNIGGISSSQISTAFSAGEKIWKAAEGLTPEQEYYLGRSVSANILASYRPLNNSRVNSYVNRVGLALAGFSDMPETFGGYHFQVLDSSEVNAFAAPGGFIFITRGFFNLMPDEEALAAVLAHEIGHVVEGHGKAAISQSNLSEAALMIGKEAAASQGGAEVRALTTAFGGSVTEVCDSLLTNGYSRSQEYDADEQAAKILKRAGYNPEGLITMLKKLDQIAAKSEGGWFSTHPDAKDRIEEVEDSVDSDDPTEAQIVRRERFSRIKSLLG